MTLDLIYWQENEGRRMALNGNILLPSFFCQSSGGSGSPWARTEGIDRGMWTRECQDSNSSVRIPLSNLNGFEPDRLEIALTELDGRRMKAEE
jgi:hypothetical protein